MFHFFFLGSSHNSKYCAQCIEANSVKFYNSLNNWNWKTTNCLTMNLPNGLQLLIIEQVIQLSIFFNHIFCYESFYYSFFSFVDLSTNILSIVGPSTYVSLTTFHSSTFYWAGKWTSDLQYMNHKNMSFLQFYHRKLKIVIWDESSHEMKVALAFKMKVNHCSVFPIHLNYLIHLFHLIYYLIYYLLFYLFIFLV